MRLVLPAVMLVLSLLPMGCSTPQPGCTPENCRAMVDACRLELVGFPSATCFAVAPRPAGFDDSSYCVNVCNAQRIGALVECIASKADECRAAPDGGKRPDQVAITCFDGGAGVPEKACEDACIATRTACDDKCSGGRPCDNCRRAGTPDCSNVCPDAGYKDCLDCSAPCGLTYINCTDACPRQ